MKKVDIEAYDKELDINLKYPYSKWSQEETKLYRIKRTPYILYTNEDEWNLEKLNDVIKIRWADLGQIIIKNIKHLRKDATIDEALKINLYEEIQEINSYSNEKLEWSEPRNLTINNMKAFTSNTKGYIKIDNKYTLKDHISIYVYTSGRCVISLLISEAYGAKPPWGNREPMLRRCIWTLEDEIEKEEKNYKEEKEFKVKKEKDYHEKEKQGDKRKLKKITLSASSLKDLKTNMENLNARLDDLNSTMYDKFNDIEIWMVDITERINQIFSILEKYELFFNDWFSKITLREEDTNNE
ncbi:MAG: hypothetical protein GF329_18730 [Candidatus Lokiarchaeota archaeon]|nr:hypothetical protein [Candidatus Lokiarchaeota archaeon]